MTIEFDQNYMAAEQQTTTMVSEICNSLDTYEPLVFLPAVKAILSYHYADLQGKLEIASKLQGISTRRLRTPPEEYHLVKRLFAKIQDQYVSRFNNSSVKFTFRKLVSGVELAVQNIIKERQNGEFPAGMPTDAELKERLNDKTIAQLAEDFRISRVAANQAALDKKTVDHLLLDLETKGRMEEFDPLAPRVPGRVIIIGNDGRLWTIALIPGVETVRDILIHLRKLKGMPKWKLGLGRGGKKAK